MSRPQRNYALFVSGKVLSALFSLLIFAICATLLWRVFFSGRLPKEMRKIQANEVLCAAAEDGALSAFTQEQGTTTRGEDNYGYFSVPRFVIIPEAEQIQVVFRYNNSTLEATARDFELDEEPEKGVEIYDVTLLSVRDLTPDDKDDNKDGSATLEKIRIAPTSKIVDTTALYTYFLYTFDGVSLENVITVFFDIYYPNGAPVDYEQDPYGTLRLYHEQSADIDVKISAKDLK